MRRSNIHRTREFTVAKGFMKLRGKSCASTSSSTENDLFRILERLRSKGVMKSYAPKMHNDASIRLSMGFRENRWPFRDFGEEYWALRNIERALLTQDFLEAVEEDHIDIREYVRRIGKGNLASYARVLVVRLQAGWK